MPGYPSYVDRGPRRRRWDSSPDNHLSVMPTVRHAAHDVFGIGSGIGCLGVIRSSTFTVRAAAADAVRIALFPSTVSAVPTRGASTSPGSAGFPVPAGDMHVVQRVQDAKVLQRGPGHRHPQVHVVPRAITGLQPTQRSFAGARDGIDSSSMSAIGSQLSPPPMSRITIQPMIPGVMSSPKIAHHGSYGAQRSFTAPRGARDISPMSAMGSQVAPPPISSIAIPPMVSGLSLSPDIPQLVGHGAQHAHGAGFQNTIPATAASGGGQNGSRALSHNARASPAQVALKHRRSCFCPANCRHAAHDLFGIGSGIGYVGGIRSSTYHVRAAPTGAGPMAVFPSTFSTVLTCGASTGTGSAGFHVPADAYVALGSGCVENEDQQSCRIQPVGAGDSGTADEEVRYPTMTLSPHD
jgi:hypothetical protein